MAAMWRALVYVTGARALFAPPLRSMRRAVARRAAAVAVDSNANLKEGIAGFYDGLSPLWEEVWGEHLHHGYYEEGQGATFSLEEHKVAQVKMIDGVLDWALSDRGDFKPQTALDVGCGIGGSSRHLARRFGCAVEGITLSPFQAGRAAKLSEAAGLADCRFKVQDALNLPSSYASKHDVVWSLESGEHMPEKAKFVDNLVDTCADGGQVILVTWCHRDLKAGERRLKWHERTLLNVINACYYLPKWCSVADYEALFKARKMTAMRRADWTRNIAPFWPAVIKTAAKPRNALRLAKTGLDGVRSAVAMFLMVLGYKIGLIKFGLITATKPAAK